MEPIASIPNINPAIAAATALIPLIMGFIWYNPKVFGNAWMVGAGLTEERAKGGNMFLIFGLTFVFSFLYAVFLQSFSIHQINFGSILQPEMNYTDPEGFTEAIKQAADLSQHKFRTFRHGVAHGVVFSIVGLLPLTIIGSLFERRNWKYILINWGYWAICTILMAGIGCQFA
jgi:hypothetical protein